MLNYIWTGMLAIGFLAGALNGKIEETTRAAFDSATKAVELGIGLLGIMCLWSGIIKIMEKSGLVNTVAGFARPLLKCLFPRLVNDRKAMGTIVMNLAANFLGLGNAATPLGIKAMEHLRKANGGSDTASDAMCMFLVLNTSAIQLIPSTVIAIRSDAGSSAPAEIIVCTWFASACAMLTGIFMVLLLSKVTGRKKIYKENVAELAPLPPEKNNSKHLRYQSAKKYSKKEDNQKKYKAG